MAKENIAFLVNLRKNTAVGSDREGRYYPEAESKEALTTKGFAKHVSEHGGLVTYEFMQLVLAAIVKCLKEMMSQGQSVKLDGLGTFRPTVTSVKNGAASIEEALTMGVNNMVAGVNFVFIPENAQGEEIQGAVLAAVRLSGGDHQEDDQRQGEVVHAAHAVVGLWHRGCRSRCRGWRRLFDKLRDRRWWQRQHGR